MQPGPAWLCRLDRWTHRAMFSPHSQRHTTVALLPQNGTADADVSRKSTAPRTRGCRRLSRSAAAAHLPFGRRIVGALRRFLAPRFFGALGRPFFGTGAETLAAAGGAATLSVRARGDTDTSAYRLSSGYLAKASALCFTTKSVTARSKPSRNLLATVALGAGPPIECDITADRSHGFEFRAASDRTAETLSIFCCILPATSAE